MVCWHSNLLPGNVGCTEAVETSCYFPARILWSVGLVLPNSVQGFLLPSGGGQAMLQSGLSNLLPGRRRSVFVYVECGSSGTHGKNCASLQTQNSGSRRPDVLCMYYAIYFKLYAGLVQVHMYQNDLIWRFERVCVSSMDAVAVR